MTDEQFNTIVDLLKEIADKVGSIDLNTANITFVEDHVRETAELLKEIKESNQSI